MNEQALSPEVLRELFLQASQSASAQRIALGGSLVLVLAVLWLVRTGRLREEYTPIWMGVALALSVISIRIEWLHALTRALGAWTSSSVVLFLGEVFLVAICLNYAVRLSRANTQLKNLAQEVALLRARMDTPGPGDAPT